jgi:hypothetical protein
MTSDALHSQKLRVRFPLRGHDDDTGGATGMPRYHERLITSER